MNRLEPILLGFFFASWLAVLLEGMGLVPLAGTLVFLPQTLYLIAVVTGWLCGNLYVRRRAQVPKELRWRFLTTYLLGPSGLFFLLWAMAPASFQTAVPLAPLYAFGASSVLFTVPVFLRRWPPERS
jgi:uncharacterized protein (DUF2062 family)